MRKHFARILTTLLALVMLLPIVVQATSVDGWTDEAEQAYHCLLYTSPSPRDRG